MPPPVIYTEAQYLALSEAIATGAMKVIYGDKTVEYRTLNDMLRIQQAMAAQLYPNQNNNNGRTVVSYSKGTTDYRRPRRNCF